MSLARTRTVVAVLCALPFLTACGSSDPTTGPAASVDGARPTADARSSDEADELLLEARRIYVPPEVKDNVRRVDPREDGWRSEALHDLAKPVLHDFLHRLIAEPGENSPALDLLLTSSFRSTPLAPDAWETVFEDRGLVVRRAPGGGDPEHGREELAGLRRALLAPFEGAQELQERAKITGVEILAPDAFLTRAFVQIYGRVGERAVQESAQWELEWSVVGDDEGARIRAIRTRDHEQAVAARPLFAELTGHVLDFPAYDEEFRRSAGSYQHRVDHLIGNPFWGHQGVAVGDVNGDGLEDLYVCQPSGLPNRLLLHRPDGTVRDDTGPSNTGYLENTASALILDMDADGAQDLVLALGHLVVVVYNDGKGVFRDIVPLRGRSAAAVYSLSAADPDRDGDLDLYACRHSNKDLLYEIATPWYDANNGSPNSFFRNDGGRAFSDATAEVGLDEHNTKFSYASIWDDFDDDGDVDLYVANDFGRNNLYRNDGGRFVDVAFEVGAADINAGMGASCADFDQDGDVDIYVSNMFSSAGQRIVEQSDLFLGGENRDYHHYFDRHARGNTLLANRGDGTFEDVTVERGVAPGGWAWGAKFVDFDNDGFEDIYSPCGFVTGPDPHDL